MPLSQVEGQPGMMTIRHDSRHAQPDPDELLSLWLNQDRS